MSADTFIIKPIMIETILSESAFSYPRNDECAPLEGFSNFMAIPGLWGYAKELQHYPDSVEGVKWLLAHANKEINDKIIGRARKLWMDAAREIHTFGLLLEEKEFVYVQYQKLADANLNVDFIVQPHNHEQVAIQASMRANWNNDRWTSVKRERRKRRGGHQWQGKIFQLTNRNRVAKSVNGCWLFTREHIEDLRDEILPSERDARAFFDPLYLD